MIKIKQAVVVEGKYDKIKLESILDAVIIETNGFKVFKDKQKQQLIRKLAQTRGLLILTDSDSAGFKIRSYIGGTVPSENIVHAYIPDILGKERRKREPSKEGKLGVEGVPVQVILNALNQSGVDCVETKEPGRAISKTDLYEDGLTGGKNSRQKKRLFLKTVGLPERLSTNAMLQMLNVFLTYEEYKAVVEKCAEGSGERV